MIPVGQKLAVKIHGALGGGENIDFLLDLDNSINQRWSRFYNETSRDLQGIFLDLSTSDKASVIEDLEKMVEKYGRRAI